MKKICALGMLLFILLIISACSNERIDVVSYPLEYDMKEMLVESLEIIEEDKIESTDNYKITADEVHFTETPLLMELIGTFNNIQIILDEILTLYNELIDTIEYYENDTFKFTVKHVDIKDTDLTVNKENTIELSHLSFELSNQHALAKKYGLPKDTMIQVDINNEGLTIELKTTQELFKFKAGESITVQSHLNGEVLDLTIHPITKNYQFIELNKESDEHNYSLSFYGNRNMGVLYNTYEVKEVNNQAITKLVDFEVFKQDTGLLYKAASLEGHDETGKAIAYTIGGYTVHMINGWKEFSINNEQTQIKILSDSYVQEQLNKQIIAMNNETYTYSYDGINHLDINFNKDEPYYIAGYFIEMNEYVEQPHLINIRSLVTSNFSLSNDIIEIRYFIEDMNDLLSIDEQAVDFQFYNVLSSAWNDVLNAEIVYIEKEDNSTQLIVFDEFLQMLSTQNFVGKIEQQTPYFIEYGNENNSPYLNIGYLDQDSYKYNIVHSLSWDMLQYFNIESITFDETANELHLMMYQGNSTIHYPVFIDLSTEKTFIQYSEVIERFIHETTNTVIDIVKNENNALLLFIYDENEKLVQVSAGDLIGNQGVELTGFDLVNEEIVIYGTNHLRPYFIQMAWTNDHQIDIDKSISYTHYVEGTVDSILFVEEAERSYFEVHYVNSSNEQIEVVKVDQKGKEIDALIKLGYLLDWDNWDPKDPRFNKLNYINYSFLYLSSSKDGTVVDSYSRAHQIRELKEHNPQMRVLISLGGWGGDYFSEAAATPENRQRFSQSTIEIMLKYGFDGVDIDWEYPGSCAADISCSPDDKVNFTLMLKQLREDLDELSKETGDDYTLTIAAGAFMGHGGSIQLTEIIKYLDFINVMTYDFGLGDWRTMHHTNLHPTKKVANSYGASYYIETFIRNGVPAEKLVLGAGFYGRGASGIKGQPDNIFNKSFSSTNSVTYTYTRIKELLETDSGFQEYWDDEAKSPYIYNGDIFVSYDNPRSIEEKLAYIKEKGLAGIFFWQFNQDASGELIDAIHQYSQ